MRVFLLDGLLDLRCNGMEMRHVLHFACITRINELMLVARPKQRVCRMSKAVPLR